MDHQSKDDKTHPSNHRNAWHENESQASEGRIACNLSLFDLQHLYIEYSSMIFWVSTRKLLSQLIQYVEHQSILAHK